MPGLVNRTKTFIPGEVLTHTDLNQAYDDVFDNFTPTYIDDCAASLGALQLAEDPYPASTESLPATLREELHRIRYVITQITNKAYWYLPPSCSFPAAGTTLTGDNGTIGAGKAKTGMWFMEDTAPSGWTLEAGCTDACLAVKGGAGLFNVSGGTKLAGSWTHLHAGGGRALDVTELPSHRHQMQMWVDVIEPYIVFFWGTSLGTVYTTVYTTSAGGGSSHNHGDTYSSKKSGGSAGDWRPTANLGIICLKD